MHHAFICPCLWLRIVMNQRLSDVSEEGAWHAEIRRRELGSGSATGLARAGHMLVQLPEVDDEPVDQDERLGRTG